MTAAPKFTPGPWKLDPGGFGVWGGQFRVADCGAFDSDEMLGMRKNATERVANARLIAAAPAMFSALRDIAERPLADREDDVIDELNRIIRFAEDALAKVQP